MNAKGNKFLRIVLWTVGILILVPIVLIATLPLWLGPIARPGINATVPRFTKTSFDIGRLYLNPYTGRFELGDFVMGNPEGYKEPTLASVSNLVFDVAITTLGDKYVHVEEVVVDGLFASVVKGGENDVDNIVQLQYNLAGGKEKYEAKEAAAKEAAQVAKADGERKAKAAEAEERAKLDAMSKDERREYEADMKAKAEAKAEAKEAAAKKFVIDHLLLRNVRVKYGFVTIPILKIELHDLGKESDGLTAEDLLNEIWQAILSSASAVGDGAKAIGGMIGTGAGKAADALGSGASAAGDAIGSGAKAVGDGAGKAMDAVKGLFK